MTFVDCGSLPDDVPVEVLPVAAPVQWRTTVSLADYQCQCAGRCSRSHRKSGGRCEKTMRGLAAERLFAVPATPGSTNLVALCGRCAEGYRTAERRTKATAAAERLNQAPTLLDLLTSTEA